METHPVVGDSAATLALALERRRRPRGTRSREHLRRELGAELETRNSFLLDWLLDLGVDADTVAAFEALPLVEVAWADGDVDVEERWRVLGGATAFGMELGSAAHAQLELWLARRPPCDLFDAWCAFAKGRLTRGDAAPHVRTLLRAVDEVAEAAGGLLGFYAVSAAERAVIERTREALSGSPAVGDA